MRITRQNLIAMIKKADSFYEFVPFTGHSYEDLLEIYKQIEKKKRNTKEPNNTTEEAMLKSIY